MKLRWRVEPLREFWFWPFYMNFTSLVSRNHRCWKTYLNAYTILFEVSKKHRRIIPIHSLILQSADTGHTFLWHRSFFPRRRYTSCGVQVGTEMSNCRQSWREEQLCTGLYIRLQGDVVPLCHQHGRYRCQRNFAVIFKLFRTDLARFSVAHQYCSIDAQFFNTTQLFKFLMNFFAFERKFHLF